MLEYGIQFQDVFHKAIGERTFPGIFVIGTFIGGTTNIQRLHKEGKLPPGVHKCYFLGKGEETGRMMWIFIITSKC